MAHLRNIVANVAQKARKLAFCANPLLWLVYSLYVILCDSLAATNFPSNHLAVLETLQYLGRDRGDISLSLLLLLHVSNKVPAITVSFIIKLYFILLQYFITVNYHLLYL